MVCNIVFRHEQCIALFFKRGRMKILYCKVRLLFKADQVSFYTSFVLQVNSAKDNFESGIL